MGQRLASGVGSDVPAEVPRVPSSQHGQAEARAFQAEGPASAEMLGP